MSAEFETTLSPVPRYANRVGLLAGGGQFPFCFADSAHKLGIEVVCVAIADHADAQLKHAVDRFYWCGLAKLGRMIRLFQQEQIDCVVMAGKIHKVAMYLPWRLVRLLPDLRMLRAWFGRHRSDNRDDSLMMALINEFRRDGIRFASALEVCPELLAKTGHLTRRQPTANHLRDIVFGWTLAKEMGRLDIGQCVAVKEESVLAIEAVEGTDAAIARAGSLCRSGDFVVVKVAKPQQDMRFDVPAIGRETIMTMVRSGAKVLAVEAERTIFIDPEATIRMADQQGVAIVAYTDEQIEQLRQQFEWKGGGERQPAWILR